MERNITASAALAMLAATALPAAADITVEYTGPGGERVSVLHVSGSDVRMDSFAQERASILFNAGERALTVIEHDSERYTVIRESDMQKLRARMEQAMDMARSAGLSAEQLQAMFPDGMNRFEVRHRRTGERRTIEGIDCEVVDTLVNGEHESSSCIASNEAIGLQGGDGETMEQFTDMLASMTMEVLPPDVFSIELAEIDGMPVQTYTPEGNVRETMSNVSGEALDASMFEVPAGFSRQDFDLGP